MRSALDCFLPAFFAIWIPQSGDHFLVDDEKCFCSERRKWRGGPVRVKSVIGSSRQDHDECGGENWPTTGAWSPATLGQFIGVGHNFHLDFISRSTVDGCLFSRLEIAVTQIIFYGFIFTKMQLILRRKCLEGVTLWGWILWILFYALGAIWSHIDEKTQCVGVPRSGGCLMSAQPHHQPFSALGAYPAHPPFQERARRSEGRRASDLHQRVARYHTLPSLGFVQLKGF